MPTVNDLKTMLSGRCGFETLDEQASPDQLRLVGRVPPNAASHWVLIIHKLLVTAERTPWKVDVSRFYYTRVVGQNQKKLFYSWRLIFQGKDIVSHLQGIMQTINDAPRPVRVELQEHPLHGAQRNHVNGKGAYAAETSPLVASVAAAARARRRC